MKKKPILLLVIVCLLVTVQVVSSVTPRIDLSNYKVSELKGFYNVPSEEESYKTVFTFKKYNLFLDKGFIRRALS